MSCPSKGLTGRAMESPHLCPTFNLAAFCTSGELQPLQPTQGTDFLQAEVIQVQMAAMMLPLAIYSSLRTEAAPCSIITQTTLLFSKTEKFTWLIYIGYKSEHFPTHFQSHLTTLILNLCNDL
jgi:hypothetical protein